MTPPPGLTCHTCRQSLALALTRRSSDGIGHTACPKTCADCGTALPATNRSGRCGPCRKRAENRAYYQTHRGRFAKPREYKTLHTCNRCAVLTHHKDRVCTDCRDYLRDHEGVEQWAS